MCWRVEWRALGWIGRRSFEEAVLYCFVVCMVIDVFLVLARNVVRRSLQALGSRRLWAVVGLMVVGRVLSVMRVIQRATGQLLAVEAAGSQKLVSAREV